MVMLDIRHSTFHALPCYHIDMFTRLTLILLTLIVAIGCSTLRRDPFRDAPSQMGRAKIQMGETATIVDAVFTKTADGDVMVSLYKGLPPAIATVKLYPDGMASFEGFGKNWWGPRFLAPAPKTPLLEAASLYVAEASLPQGKHTILTSTSRSDTDVFKGRLRTISVSCADGQNQFEVKF